MKKHDIIIRNLKLTDWKNVFDEMNNFTHLRDKYTLDEIWFLEHRSIYTTGQHQYINKKLYINNVPVLYSNRGGKITYHGPGQQIVYLLLDLQRLNLNIRDLLCFIEKVVLNTLYYFSIIGYNNKLYPGIYVNNKKICSIGLRIHRGCCFHGFALNVNMDLNPFKHIYPCGNSSIIMTQMYEFKKNIILDDVSKILTKNILLFLQSNNVVCV